MQNAEKLLEGLQGLNEEELLQQKRLIEQELERRESKRIEEAFQKIAYLDDIGLKQLIERIQLHFQDQNDQSMMEGTSRLSTSEGLPRIQSKQE